MIQFICYKCDIITTIIIQHKTTRKEITPQIKIEPYALGIENIVIGEHIIPCFVCGEIDTMRLLSNSRTKNTLVLIANQGEEEEENETSNYGLS
mgnify:FL=1